LFRESPSLLYECPTLWWFVGINISGFLSLGNFESSIQGRQCFFTYEARCDVEAGKGLEHSVIGELCCYKVDNIVRESDLGLLAMMLAN
jgi:hypothetical protein